MWGLTNWSLCVKNGDGKDKEVKSPRCKLGLLLPMAYAVAYVLKRGLGAFCATELMTGNYVGPATQPASLPSKLGGICSAQQPAAAASISHLQHPSAQELLTSLCTKFCLTLVVLACSSVNSTQTMSLLDASTVAEGGCKLQELCAALCRSLHPSAGYVRNQNPAGSASRDKIRWHQHHFIQNSLETQGSSFHSLTVCANMEQQLELQVTNLFRMGL